MDKTRSVANPPGIDRPEGGHKIFLESEKQFYEAKARKDHSDKAVDAEVAAVPQIDVQQPAAPLGESLHGRVRDPVAAPQIDVQQPAAALGKCNQSPHRDLMAGTQINVLQPGAALSKGNNRCI